MKLSSCDVTSCNGLGDRFCFSRIGGGGWVHHLETPWLALGATAEKIVLSPCTAPISGGEAFSQSGQVVAG